jgi:RNA polymerase sigma-70 factor (ECF subfamily)
MRIVETRTSDREAPTDRDLVERARRGDRDAFGRLVARERERLVALARALVGDHHAGEDCAQEAFVAAYRRLSTLKDPDRFRAWLARILVRLAHRARRRLRRPDPLPTDLATVPRGADDRDEVRVALGRLRERDRTILALRYLDDLTYADIAAVTGVDVKKIKSRLHDARGRLRKRVETLRRSAEVGR